MADPVSTTTVYPLTEGLTEAPAVGTVEEYVYMNTTEAAALTESVYGASHLRQRMTTARAPEEVPYYLV